MPSADDRRIKAVMFDFSGTLATLQEKDSWFAGMGLDSRQRADVMDRMTHPTGRGTHPAWAHRDLDAQMHRAAYMHVLRESGLPEEHAEALYARCVDPAEWAIYPDAGPALAHLRANGIRTAVVSNICWDIRPTFNGLAVGPDDFVLSFEVGAIKPDPQIFGEALSRLGVGASEALMVGDSAENDGGAGELGCAFALVEPLPLTQRPTGLLDALRDHGLGP